MKEIAWQKNFALNTRKLSAWFMADYFSKDLI
jgi:hypothetical protein